MKTEGKNCQRIMKFTSNENSYKKNDEFSLNENDIVFPIQNQNKQKIIILLPCIVCIIIVLTVMMYYNCIDSYDNA